MSGFKEKKREMIPKSENKQYNTRNVTKYDNKNDIVNFFLNNSIK
jgi:hypothetical protein